MPHKQNAPSLRAESVACHLAVDSDVPSTRHRIAQFPAPILSRHWFRDSDLLEMLR